MSTSKIAKVGRNSTAYIRDEGSVAPGVTVKHKFRQSEGELISPLFSHPDIRCSTESVHFADGTVSTRPQ